MAVGGVFLVPFDGIPVWLGPVLLAVGGAVAGISATDTTKGDK